MLGDDGHKLSKRHGAVSVMQYAEDGFLPEAMLNFLARLGWAHGDDEVFTREQLVEWFDLKHIHPAPARFDGTKLRWVNHEHIKRAPAADLGAALAPFLARDGSDVAAGPAPAAVAELLRDRAPTLVEMAEMARYFYRDVSVPEALRTAHLNERSRAALVEPARRARASRMEPREHRRPDQGHCRAARAQGGAGDDAAARARRRHGQHAGDRRGARAPRPGTHPRAADAEVWPT